MLDRPLVDPFGLVGATLDGQYRIDALVGEGGFGVVYRGRHLSLDQPIAIKVLKGLDAADPRINELVLGKFREEARLLYTLSQSSLHIVRSMNFGAVTTPNGIWAPYMVLEWLEGRALSDDLDDRRARGLRGRSVEEALAILEPVAEGLAVAHKHHVAHRDIKPANIFLLASGPNVKVLDFGIAKIMKEGEEAGTRGTFASFTWLYAAPEQLDPRLGQTGLATDVYAFTLLLTELLTDLQPVDEHDVVGIMRASTDPMRRPTPRTRGANVPDDLENVCRRALSVDPRSRYATISELWSALSAARAMRAAVITHAQPAMRPSVTAIPATSVQSGPFPSSMAATAMAPSVGAPPSPPRYQAPPQGYAPSPPAGVPVPMGYPLGPPPGTAPPWHQPHTQHRPMVPPNSNNVVVVTIVFFVLASLFAASCAIVHAAC